MSTQDPLRAYIGGVLEIFNDLSPLWKVELPPDRHSTQCTCSVQQGECLFWDSSLWMLATIALYNELDLRTYGTKV